MTPRQLSIKRKHLIWTLQLQRVRVHDGGTAGQITRNKEQRHGSRDMRAHTLVHELEQGGGAEAKNGGSL